MIKLTRLLIALCVSARMLTAAAQSDDVLPPSIRMTLDEQARLKRLALEPVPQDASPVAKQGAFVARLEAAQRLGEPELVIEVLRQWVAAVPNAYTPRLNLANFLGATGQFDAAIASARDLLPITREEVDALSVKLIISRNQIELRRLGDARQTLSDVAASVARMGDGPTEAHRKVIFLRNQAALNRQQGQLFVLFGKVSDAVSHFDKAIAASVSCQTATATTPEPLKPTLARGCTADLVNGYFLKADLLQDAGRPDAAEAALNRGIQETQRSRLPGTMLANAYKLASRIRLAEGEFRQSEGYARRADAIFAEAGYVETNPRRLSMAADIAAALEGQGRWTEALSLLDRQAAAAARDAALREQLNRRSHDRFYKGLALLELKRFNEAVAPLDEYEQSGSRSQPEHGFLRAEAVGLAGVARWRSGVDRHGAYERLKSAVADYMLPDNFEYETAGLHRLARDLIFSAHLDAAFAQGEADGARAVGPADWARGGSVQDALTDAAVRAAASDSGLADLVRQDQDAKHEMEALRALLQSVQSGAQPAAQLNGGELRDRIAELYRQRQSLQARVKAGFPKFESLARPAPAPVEAVSKSLAADEAFIVLVPAADATYEWVITNSGVEAAVRVELPLAAVSTAVAEMRKTLDFGVMGDRVPDFDRADSIRLYEQLFGPIRVRLAGKTHVIIAPSGPLAQIPFGVLLTKPATAADGASAWLIHDFAITHVASLAAWLAARQLASEPSAPEALAAWGDPAFAYSEPPMESVAGKHRNLNLVRSSADSAGAAGQAAIRYDQVPRLPDTRDELNAIAQALNVNSDKDLHFGPNATRASVLQANRSGELARKQIVAFATHGLVPGDLPGLTEPALALAGTGREDKEPLAALLTLDDVLTLRLNATWVLLSACNTAAAGGQEQEALSGLARGFFYAGSRSVLATHWSVESESAKLLTTTLFTSHAAKPSERKAQSLRNAMLRVMSVPKYRHPAYWAPYVIVGDGGR